MQTFYPLLHENKIKIVYTFHGYKISLVSMLLNERNSYWKSHLEIATTNIFSTHEVTNAEHISRWMILEISKNSFSTIIFYYCCSSTIRTGHSMYCLYRTVNEENCFFSNKTIVKQTWNIDFSKSIIALKINFSFCSKTIGKWEKRVTATKVDVFPIVMKISAKKILKYTLYI